MFDQSQLVKLVSALNTVLEENKTDLDNFSSGTHIQGPIKIALNDKMRALQSAASVAVNALKQIQDLKQEKEKLIDANKNLKEDLFNLCDVNIELEDQMSKLKDQVQLQKEQLVTSEKTQEVLEKQKNDIQILLEERLKRQEESGRYNNQGKQEINSKMDTEGSQSNAAWKQRYNGNVSHIKKQLQQLRKATSDLRTKIAENQNRIKRSLRPKKSKQELIEVHGSSLSSNYDFKRETAKRDHQEIKREKCQSCFDVKNLECSRCTQVSEDTQQESEVGVSRIRKLSSFDQQMLNELVQNLLLKNKIDFKSQEPKKQSLSYVDKILKGLEKTHNFLFQKIVKDRIKTGIVEPKPIGKRRRLSRLQAQQLLQQQEVK